MELEVFDETLQEELLYTPVMAFSGSTGIMLSTLWNQSGIARVGNNTSITYNEYCPFISGTRTHSVTGCTNTAAGQIIYYFIEKGLLDFQLTLDAADAYTDDNGLQIKEDGSTPGTVSFSVINSKLADYDINSADDAAALVYACGVVQEANYGSSTGTAWSLDLFYRSGFECANRAYLWAGDSVFWGAEGAISEGGFEVLIENLTAGRVVGTSYPGHALVIDGYDSGTDKFHINYGWGNSTATRWYTRAEMNAIGYHDFIYDLMPEGEKDLFVTDSRIYGTGTLARALELAKGTKGANTVTVDKSLAGEKLAGNMNFRFKEETTVRNFNMELMTFSSSSYGYGFVSENDAVGIFTDFTGALITVGGNYGYAFSFSSSDRLELSTDQAVIYAGNYRVNGDAGAGAEAVLASLRASQKEDSDVAGFVIDTSQSSYSISAGAGNDLIVLDNNTIVAGKISLQGGDDTLSVTGGSHVYGDINCGDGSNVITIDSTSSITGCFYGTADLNFVLTAVPDDEASFVITRNVSNLRSNAAITVDVSKATAGKYTLITADSSASYISNLDYIQLTVTAGMQESFALSVNGGADCRYAELLREGNSLVLRVKGYDDEDKTAPTVPASLTASVSGNSVQLDWGDSTDNNRVEGYFFRYGTSASLSGDGEFVTDSEAVISGLENGTWYYQVRAKDGSGNLSNWSTVRSFTVNYTPQYVTLESGGLLVSAAAAMTGKTVSGSGAKMNVSSGGTASRTLVLDGGIQSVSSGGKGSDTKVSSGGFAQILFSGTMKDLTIYESGSAAVLRSGTLSNATVSGGVLHLSSGGAASGVTVKSGGELVLRPNGSARNVTVSQGGTILGFTLLSGTSSYNTLTCNDFSINNAAVKSGTSAFAYSGAKVSNVDVYSGGRLYVLSGASATLIYNPWRGTVVSSGGAYVNYLDADARVYYGGSAYGILSSGAALNSLTVSYGQEIYVYSGGSAKEITLLSSGKIYISSGGTVSSLHVSVGGTGYLSGGTLQSGTVESSGCVIVDQGVLSNTTVKSGGSVLLSGGSADNTSLAGGTMYVKSGAKAGNIQVFSGGRLYLSSGASGGTVEVNQGGYAYGSSGASLSSVILNTYADIDLTRGFKVNSLQLANGGIAYLYGSASSASVNSRGYLILASGGKADQITIASGGRVHCHNEGSVGDTTVARGGMLLIRNSAEAYGNITVCGTLRTRTSVIGTLDMKNHTLTLDLRERYAGDAYFVDNLANISNSKLAITVSATQNSGIYEIARGAADFAGTITVSDGKTSGNLAVGSSLSLGQSTYTLTVSTSGFMHLTVENSGTNTIPKVADYTPGTWSTDWEQASKYARENNKLIFACYGDVTWKCGFDGNLKNLLMENPELLEFAKENLVLLYDTVPAGMTHDTGLYGKLMDCHGNILAQKINFDSTGIEAWMTWLKLHLGKISGIYSIENLEVSSYTSASLGDVSREIYAAGTALSGTQILNGGSLTLLSGGKADSATINSGGKMSIFSGGTADRTTINSGGRMYISSGGTADSATINSSGFLHVSGGTANAAVVNSGGKIYIFNGGTADRTTVNPGGGIYISSGGTASNAQINSGGWITVLSSGIANDTVVNSGGGVYISSGGLASDTVINSGGYIYVRCGSASGIEVKSSGKLYVSEGGVVADVDISESEGILQLYSGGTISGLTIASGAKAYLRPGTEVTGINAVSGAILGFDVAPDTYFQGSYAGKAFEQKSGTLSNYDIHSGCHVSVCSGGTVSKGSVLSGGTLCLLSGASAAGAVVNGGFMDVFSSGIAENTVICSGGYVRVRDFGSAIGTLIESGASMYVHSSNGYAYDTLISGFGRVYDGAAMSKVTIASGGSFHLWRGGILKDAEIQYGGLLDIRESSSILSGDVLVAGQLDISFDHKTDFSNADIVVDISERKTSDTYSIVNLNYIGETTISINVADNQARGTYKFASNGANFTDTISIGSGTKVFGTLSVGGSVKYGDYTYELLLNGKNLDLTVKASVIPAPTVTADVTTPTNGNVLLSAVFDEFSTVREYRIDGGAWQSYTAAVSVSQNCKVEFRCKDAQDVYSSITLYDVTNIDRSAPVISVTGNLTQPARKVILTASADDGSALLYSFDNVNYQQYKDSVTVTANGTVYFKSTDAAGNTAQKTVQITNIDLNAPDAPAVTADVTAFTNKAVTLTIHFTANAAVKEYSKDGKNWQTSPNTLVVTENGTLYFRETDSAGNVSDVATYIVSNIDKLSPGVPENMTFALSGKTLSIDWNDAADQGSSGVKGYEFRYGKSSSLSGSGEFAALSTAKVTDLEDGTWYFQVRSVDAAGNYSNWSRSFSTVLDRVAPEITLNANTEQPVRMALLTASVDDGSTIMYRRDSGSWQLYTAALTVAENGTWYFKATDAAGNTSEKSITFNNIDADASDKPVVFADITEPTRNNVTVTALFTANAVKKQYSLNGTKWYTYSSPITFNGNTTVYFREIDGAGNISETVSYSVSNIDKSAPDVPANFEYTQNSVNWNAAADNGTAGVTGYYFRYGSSSTLSGEGYAVETNSFEIADLAEGTWYCQVKSVDAAGNTSNWSELFTFTVSAGLTGLAGTAAGVTWQDGSGAGAYRVEYSQDNFEHLLSVELSGCGADTFGMPQGVWQWRADIQNGANYVEGNEITAQGSAGGQAYVSDADSVADIFFANAQGVWENGYAAQHQQSFEMVLLEGKNRITDIFKGSADASVLLLTDDSNGDALFVDDVYSALGDQARMSQIDEIRAGAGNDIVDMTSKQYAYEGGTIRIHGGEGDDLLWGSAAGNILFGDAGNDRLAGAGGNDILSGGAGDDFMQGGGGSDIFTFGSNWGVDRVEQSSSGSVILWFESGDMSCWDAENFTYSDGINSVTVAGCANVTVKFGSDGTLPDGCFEAESSRRVFEESRLA